MRRQLQALFVAFHCLAVGVMSIPDPPPEMQGEGGDAMVEQSVAAWADAAARVGIAPESFTSALHRGSAAWAELLDWAKTPFRAYTVHTGARQSWLMFGVVPRHVATLEIDVKRSGSWEPLYRARSADHAFLRPFLEQERMRTLVHSFSSKRRRRTYDDFTGFVRDRAAAEGVDGQRIRVRMRAVLIPDPATLRQTGNLELRKAFWTREHPL